MRGKQMSDKIQLAVGYVGVTREGKRVEIVRKYPKSYTYMWIGDNCVLYTDKGTCSLNEESPRDIVRPLRKPVNYNDGNWHRWGGDAECPVHKDTVVQVKYIERETVGGFESAASLYVWGSVLAPIVAFRVTKEYVKPVKPREFWLLQGYFHSYEPDNKDAIHVREVIK
jgi:hypothetical protein